MTKSTNTGWIPALALGILWVVMIVWLLAMLMSPVSAGELEQTIADSNLVAPYLWEIMAFIAVLGVLRLTQGLKRLRGLPLCLCNVKHSQDGKHSYRKLKSFWLESFATVGAFVVITACLSQKYNDINQVMLISGICAVSQFSIIKLIFKFLDARKPGLSEILSNGLYVSENDQTVMTRMAQSVVGGGVDKRT
jgi:hypothetical protein